MSYIKNPQRLKLFCISSRSNALLILGISRSSALCTRRTKPALSTGSVRIVTAFS
ncbi:hypothetical protein HMPREF9123_1167, partial [Neisseria bacilliformis ATCC BAA-1200]